MWISAIFSQIFWNYNKMNENNRQICEDQIVTFKQSHILYQGLLFLTRSTCVIVDARSHTCKSHNFIPRYDINHQTLFYDVLENLPLEVHLLLNISPKVPRSRNNGKDCNIRIQTASYCDENGNFLSLPDTSSNLEKLFYQHYRTTWFTN